MLLASAEYPVSSSDCLPQCTTVRGALAWAIRFLSSADIPSPRLDAEVLLAHVLGCNRAQLYARPELALTDPQRQAFLASAERRYRHEPVPYIIGQREFYGLDFIVDHRVLIPRPETELLVELALESATRFTRQAQGLFLADVGTGSGIIAISLAVNLPDAIVCATEISRQALEVATLNAVHHGVSDRVHFLLGDQLTPMCRRMHIIAANLPYVPTGQLSSLAPDVTAYEPLIALDGGADGLEHINRLLARAERWLLPRGVILLEIGAEQGLKVMSFAKQYYPKATIELFHDYAGLDRVVRISV